MNNPKLERPRVLMIAPFSPWPARGGGELRSARFAEAAAEVATVRLLSLYCDHSQQGPDTVDEVVIRAASHPVLWWMRDAERPLAPMLAPMLLRRINRHIAEFRPDLIIFEQTVTTGILEALDAHGARLVFSTQNFDTDLLAPTIKSGAFQTRGAALKTILENGLKQEVFAAKTCDFVICCSDLDVARFKLEADVNAYLVSNPIPDERVFDLPLAISRYENKDVLFVGSMMYAPNQEAVDALISIFPKVLPQEAKLVLAGRAAEQLPPKVIQNPSVRLASNPPDILPFLQDAGFTAMPIRSGSGTRLKVLEAMAAGVVVIATQKAVEGLGLVPGVHFVQAETDADFKNAYLLWTSKPEACLALAREARAYVANTYSTQIFKRQVHETLLDMLQDRDLTDDLRNDLCEMEQGNA